MIRHIYSILFILITIHSTHSFAACSPNKTFNSGLVIPNYTANLDTTPVNGPIGSEIIGITSILYYCTGSDTERTLTLYAMYNNALTTINGRAVYPTTNSGIGFSIGLEIPNACPGLGVIWQTSTTAGIVTKACTDTIHNNGDYNYQGRIHLILYKLKRVVNDNRIGIQLAMNFNLTIYGGSLPLQILYSPNPPNFSYTTISTCSLSSASTTSVNLPKVYGNNFVANGISAGSTPFNITVNCPSPTNLNITFTDNNNLGNNSTILTPLASSTAKGLGIQLQYNGNIIGFGPDSSDPGTTNQIVLNGNLTGSQSFPFTASYVRTGAVSPGTLSARATFTLSYQ